MKKIKIFCIFILLLCLAGCSGEKYAFGPYNVNVPFSWKAEDISDSDYYRNVSFNKGDDLICRIYNTNSDSLVGAVYTLIRFAETSYANELEVGKINGMGCLCYDIIDMYTFLINNDDYDCFLTFIFQKDQIDFKDALNIVKATTCN